MRWAECSFTTTAIPGAFNLSCRGGSGVAGAACQFSAGTTTLLLGCMTTCGDMICALPSRWRWPLWGDRLRQAHAIDVEIRSNQRQLDTPSGPRSKRHQHVQTEFVMLVAHQVRNTRLPYAKSLCCLHLRPSSLDNGFSKGGHELYAHGQQGSLFRGKSLVREDIATRCDNCFLTHDSDLRSAYNQAALYGIKLEPCRPPGVCREILEIVQAGADEAERLHTLNYLSVEIRSQVLAKHLSQIPLLHRALLVVGASSAFGYARLKKPRTSLHTQVASLDFVGLWSHSPIVWDFLS